MKSFVVKTCAVVAITAGFGAVAAPAMAAPLPVGPAQAQPIVVPETGSAGTLNALLCALQSISAEVVCIQT